MLQIHVSFYCRLSLYIYFFNILLISCKIAQPNGTKPGSDDSWKEEMIMRPKRGELGKYFLGSNHRQKRYNIYRETSLWQLCKLRWVQMKAPGFMLSGPWGVPKITILEFRETNINCCNISFYQTSDQLNNTGSSCSREPLVFI